MLQGCIAFAEAHFDMMPMFIEKVKRKKKKDEEEDGVTANAR